PRNGRHPSNAGRKPRRNNWTYLLIPPEPVAAPLLAIASAICRCLRKVGIVCSASEASGPFALASRSYLAMSCLWSLTIARAKAVSKRAPCSRLSRSYSVFCLALGCFGGVTPICSAICTTCCRCWLWSCSSVWPNCLTSSAEPFFCASLPISTSERSPSIASSRNFFCALVAFAVAPPFMAPPDDDGLILDGCDAEFGDIVFGAVEVCACAAVTPSAMAAVRPTASIVFLLIVPPVFDICEPAHAGLTPETTGGTTRSVGYCGDT